MFCACKKRKNPDISVSEGAFNQNMANEWIQGAGVILLAGRFEGVDQRVIDHYGIQEVSLGDFVMSGGEIAAQAMIDACVRLLSVCLAMRPLLSRKAINTAP